jgi:hypothetical protein
MSCPSPDQPGFSGARKVEQLVPRQLVVADNNKPAIRPPAPDSLKECLEAS